MARLRPEVSWPLWSLWPSWSLRLRIPLTNTHPYPKIHLTYFSGGDVLVRTNLSSPGIHPTVTTTSCGSATENRNHLWLQEKRTRTARIFDLFSFISPYLTRPPSKMRARASSEHLFFSKSLSNNKPAQDARLSHLPVAPWCAPPSPPLQKTHSPPEKKTLQYPPRPVPLDHPSIHFHCNLHLHMFNLRA